MDTNDHITINVLFFAKSRELSGRSNATLCVKSKIKSGELLELLCSTYNLQSIRNNLLIALNQEYQSDMTLLLALKENDEIAVIPPISGG
uniref:Molybdopterin synthase sulfur carrier subunit n=1 Tax=Xenopsylla cheopis TaxID=163159 RepID=A0A6M2DL39_XENCH